MPKKQAIEDAFETQDTKVKETKLGAKKARQIALATAFSLKEQSRKGK